MDPTHQNIRRLIEIRDKAVDSKDENISEEELYKLSHESIKLAENSEILDQSKYKVLRQLLDLEIRSYKHLVESGMSKQTHADNLIFFCVSIITIIHGKLDI